MLFHTLFSFSRTFGIKNVSGSEPAIISCKSPNPVSLKWTIRNQRFINTLPLLGLRNYFFCLCNRASIVLGHQLWDRPCPQGFRLFSRQKAAGETAARRGRDLRGVSLQVNGKTVARARVVELRPASRCFPGTPGPQLATHAPKVALLVGFFAAALSAPFFQLLA